MTETRHDAATGGGTGTGQRGPRDRAIEAFDDARERVAGAGRSAAESIDDAPLLALAGGIAAGALLAALLPRSEGESKLLRPVGDKLGGTAKAAARAAKDAGSARLGELGLTRDKGADALRSILEGAGDAAKASAQAALGTVRRDRD